jgi:hypothetical protein
MGAFKQLQIMIDSLEVGKKYRVEIYDIDRNDFGQEPHECIYVKSTFYGKTQVLSFEDCKTSETFSIDIDHITNIEEIDDEDNDKKKGNEKKKFSNVLDEMDGDEKVSPEDDTGELDIHCKKIDIKVKETKPTWKDDVLKTLGILYRPFIFIGERDGDEFAVNPAMFIKKDEQQLQFVMLKQLSKLSTIILINPEDVIGEYPRYTFFRIESLDPSYKISYVHSDHFVDYGIKFDVSPVPQPELELGKLYVVKTDGKTRIGILHAIMDDYLKFIVNDFNGMEIGKMVIRAEDMKDTEIYKVDDDLWEE